MKAVIIAVIKRVFALLAIYCATRNWHIYVRDGQHKKDGWKVLMLAVIQTLIVFDLTFN